MIHSIRFTVSALALVTAAPAFAQNDDIEVLTGWNYDALYSSGWSVEDMLDTTELIGPDEEIIGDIDNVIFSNDGEVLGIIASVGGFWDIPDTHVHVAWADVELGDTIDQAAVPVSEETVEEYDVFDGLFEEETITEDEAQTTDTLEGSVATGPNIFKATDLIGDYAYLSDGARYGYIADILVEDGTVAAIVTDAASYGRGGYYAYPYSYRGVSPADGSRYVMPYSGSLLDTIEQFDYEQLKTRPDA